MIVDVNPVIVAANDKCAWSHLNITYLLVGLSEHELIPYLVRPIVETECSNYAVFAAYYQFIPVWRQCNHSSLCRVTIVFGFLVFLERLALSLFVTRTPIKTLTADHLVSLHVPTADGCIITASKEPVALWVHA